MTRPRVFIAAITAGILGSLQAPAAWSLDLAEAWRLAAKNDPELSAAQFSMLADREARPQARSALLPNVQLSANTANQQRHIQGAGSENYNNHGWSASLTQAIFRPSEYFQYKGAKALTQRVESEFAARQQNLIVRVSSAYFDVLRSEDNLESARAEEKALESQYEQARERHEVGLIAMTDVHEAQAAHDLARVARIVRAGELDVAREVLESLVGSPFQDTSRLADEMPALPPDPSDREAWVQAALEGNHSLRAARHASDAAREDWRARKSEHLPTVDFVASHDRSVQGGVSFLGGKLENQTYSLQLRMPLYMGGLTQSRVREAEHRIGAAHAQFDDVMHQVREDIRVLHRMASTDVLNIKALKQSIVSARSALEATETGYEVGTRNVVDVLQAKRRVFAAERDYANARYDFLINTMRLKEAAGTLGPEDVEALNQWLK